MTLGDPQTGRVAGINMSTKVLITRVGMETMMQT